MDYCFLGSAEKSDFCCPILVVYDNVLEAIWALPVQAKGQSKQTVDWIVNKLDEAGYRAQQVTLKSDGEPAITALRKAVAAARIGVTPLIDSPVRESKANGAVEAAIKVFSGQLRTFKHQYEHLVGLHKQGRRLLIDHAMMGWLVLWTTEILLKFRPRVADGRTAYEAMVGHRCKHPIFGVGEIVSFRTVVDKCNRHKADSDWREGAFLGVDTKSTQFLIGTASGIYKTSYHEVKRLTKERAYQEKYMNEVVVTVDDYLARGASADYGPVKQSSDVVGGAEGGRGDNGERGYAPRSVRITEDDGRKYGFTSGCVGCTWLQNRLGPRRGHTTACRDRFTQLMADDVDDQDKVARATARQTEWIAKEVETADQKEPEVIVEDMGAQPSEARTRDEGQDQDMGDDEARDTEQQDENDEPMGEEHDDMQDKEIETSEQRSKKPIERTPSPRKRPKDKRRSDSAIESSERKVTGRTTGQSSTAQPTGRDNTSTNTTRRPSFNKAPAQHQAPATRGFVRKPSC